MSQIKDNKFRQSFPETERNKLLELSTSYLFSRDGAEALNYLLEKRKLTKDVISKFKLGYIPSWFKRKEDGFTHELASRITMPVFNQYDELVAFSSRNWREGINNRGFWHESFEKSNYLYGLNIAKNNIRINKKVIIVEGEIDVMSMHKIGLNFTVGILGSSISLYQISILRRYCKDIFLAFDSDQAGDSLYDKLYKMYKEYSLNKFDLNFIKVKFPKPSELKGYENEKKIDADFYVNKLGKSSLIDLLKKSRENHNTMYKGSNKNE